MLRTRPSLMNVSLGSGDSTAPSSNTSPVLMSFVARSTVSGFSQFPAPRWSPAPHFEGHRSESAGIFQDALWAMAIEHHIAASGSRNDRRSIGLLRVRRTSAACYHTAEADRAALLHNTKLPNIRV